MKWWFRSNCRHSSPAPTIYLCGSVPIIRTPTIPSTNVCVFRLWTLPCQDGSSRITHRMAALSPTAASRMHAIDHKTLDVLNFNRASGMNDVATTELLNHQGQVRFRYPSDTYNCNSASRVVPRIIELFAPRSVVDVGCGLGTWLETFRTHGVEELLGIDQSR